MTQSEPFDSCAIQYWDRFEGRAYLDIRWNNRILDSSMSMQVVGLSRADNHCCVLQYARTVDSSVVASCPRHRTGFERQLHGDPLVTV